MEIRALSLRIGEEELNGWIARLLANNARVRELTIQGAGAGFVVRGEAQLMRMWIPFDATLEAGAEGDFVVMRLVSFQAAGFFPVGPSLIMGELGKLQREWLKVEDDMFVLNLKELIQGYGVTVSPNLSSIHSDAGCIVLEAQLAEEKLPPAP